MASAFDPFAAPEHLSAMARYRSIDRLDRIFEGTQYEGRPDWWTGVHKEGEDPVPVQRRKPCIRYKLAAAATHQVVRFLFGDERYPKVVVPYDDEETDAKEGDVTEEQSKQIERWIDDLTEAANLKPVVRSWACRGIACKTSVLIVELIQGRFRFKQPRPQDCYAEFANGDPRDAVLRFVWCYEFDKEVVDPQTSRPRLERYYFRRDWDTRNVTIYPEIKKELGKRVEWYPERVEPHGLSFCPVLWARNDAEDLDSIDGRGLYEGLESDLEALDLTLSRRHQGVIALGTPQPFETGVEEGDGPGQSEPKGAVGGFASGTAESATGIHGKAEPRGRRTAPDLMWTYQGRQVSVGLLETSGKAFEVGTNHINDIRSRCLETMGVVLTSMADTVSRVTSGAEMSAKFLALAHAPLIVLVQEYRHTWWPHAMSALLSMCMRMTAEVTRSGKAVAVVGTDQIAGLLQSFLTPEGWKTPRMTPKWGRFFEPSSQEVQTNVEASIKAKDGGLIQPKTAVQQVAHDFGVDDIQAEIKAIEEKQAEEKQAEDELLEIARGTGKGAPGRSPPNGGGRSSSAAPASKAKPRGAPLAG